MSSKKGGQYERELCKKLSLWWTDGKRDDVFWRASGSGGRATGRSKKGISTANSHGDVCLLDPVGKPFLDILTIEIKRGYSNSTMFDTIDKPKKCKQQFFEAFYQQVTAAWKAAGSYSWMLIVKRDKREPIVFVPKRFMDLFFWDKVQKPMPLPSIQFRSFFRQFEGKGKKSKFVGKTADRLFGYTLNFFLESFTPEDFCRICDEIK